MKIGFTGTRDGMTEAQKVTVKKILKGFRDAYPEFHHGDCVGADADAHEIAEKLRYHIVIHPPTNNSLRAYCKGEDVSLLDLKPYLVRNKDIVKDTETLIATPNGFKEKQQSGTWSTVRFAQKQNKFILIVWPDGTVKIG